MSNIHQMYFAQAMNRKLYQQGSPEANVWADRVAEAFKRDSLLCAAYNHDIAQGKWNGMMTQKHIGYTSWNDNFPRDIMPRTQRINDSTPGGYVFEMNDGRVVMDAEHYFEAKSSEGTQWTVIPEMGRTRSAVALMPYTEKADGASLVYRWNGQKLTTADIRVVTKSTLDFLNKGGLTFTVQLDDSEPQVVNFNERLNEDPRNVYSVYYPTVARRVVESKVQLSSQAAEGVHTLTIRPQDPAIVFEKIIVDATGKLPSTYLFGTESNYKKAQ